ncbi:hypothetical protein WJX75_005171 [Coccomyxa subellipsoidea]|uniref:Mitochondrial inner membrane protease ATP23 n=1 Tax=Coccomyxa subellipsoidea TaxID=248742 RepID=A0ABR2YW79_9CHLO
MLEKLEEAGCPVGERFFSVESCSEAVGGGFRLPDGVVICSNHLSAQEEELMRGNTGFRGQHQRCVRRRAELSVAMNPHCRGPGRAKQAVDNAFEQCFADTAPFDRIP